MKRFRVRAVGLGLALAAGSAVAADDWRAPGQPAPPVTVGSPALLPPGIRTAPSEPGVIWLPAREPSAAPLVVPVGGQRDPIPVIPVPMPPAPVPAGDPVPAPAAPRTQPQLPPPTKWPPEPTEALPAGPRTGGELSGPLPAIPVPEAPALSAPQPAPRRPALPATPHAERTAVPAPQQPDPVPVAPTPTPVDPPPMMVPPRVPDLLPPSKADALPQPRPLETKPQPYVPPELQPAPPELMYPAGALQVNKHGTFGSPPIRISRDYPPLQDLIHPNGAVSLASEENSLASRLFVRGEYLLWWMPGFPVPVLGTTNSNPGGNGFFNEPGTSTILGPGSLIGSTRSGFRVRAGAWLNDSHSCGIDAGFFFLGSLSETVARTPDQFGIITRPVFVPNVISGTNIVRGEFGEAVSVPGVLRGILSADSDSQLWGADVNLRKCLFTRCDSRAEFFVGYRHLNLRESLTIGENITVIGMGNERFFVSDPIGTRVLVQDRFATRNSFNGGQIGAVYEHRFGRWDVDARGVVALGATHQTLEINGFQRRLLPDGTAMNFPGGGLLAAASNSGRFTRDKFSVVPEFTLNAGYWVTPHLRVFAGYNFLLWTNVIRPGDQIDRVVDRTFVPNTPPSVFSGQFRPRPPFAQRDLVVNGAQIGLEWRW